MIKTKHLNVFFNEKQARIVFKYITPSPQYDSKMENVTFTLYLKMPFQNRINNGSYVHRKNKDQLSLQIILCLIHIVTIYFNSAFAVLIAKILKTYKPNTRESSVVVAQLDKYGGV